MKIVFHVHIRRILCLELYVYMGYLPYLITAYMCCALNCSTEIVLYLSAFLKARL